MNEHSMRELYAALEGTASGGGVASARQVGGDHYSSLTVQPWDAFEAWFSPQSFADYLNMTALAYLAREKWDVIEDNAKAIHCLEKRGEVLRKMRDLT